MAGFRLKPCCRRRLALLLIALGSLLVLIGCIFFLMNRNISNDTEEMVIEEVVSEVLVSEEAIDEIIEVKHPAFFEGSYRTINRMTYMISDGMVAEEDDIPDFHNVSLIIAEPGINPKTEEASDNVRISLRAIPDREFSVTVVVSATTDEILEMKPDSIAGVQWSMSYAEDAFRKTAREVLGDGTIVEKEAEDFNARYIGNEGVAEVEFFGPLGTKYYAIIIHDATYTTLILP